VINLNDLDVYLRELADRIKDTGSG